MKFGIIEKGTGKINSMRVGVMSLGFLPSFPRRTVGVDGLDAYVQAAVQQQER
jgi:hypothetical protein